MSTTYPDPNAQMSGAPGAYTSHNESAPSQQQQEHMTDPELRLQANLQQLRDGGDMMHAGNQPQSQYHQLAQMPPNMNAHPHFQSPARPTHSPQQMAHAVMSLEGQHDTYDPNDPSRKRSKVSRACDECRRKKIRCDATSENGPEACSSCKRTGARCQFSRQPMKRGPSKGYIKELADRLNSLESQIHHPTGSSANFDFGSINDANFANNQSPPQFSRKRTHSMTDDFQDAFSRPSWSIQEREPALNGNRRTSFGEMSLIGSLVTGSNEEVIKAYYNVIHPTLPIIPHDSAALNRLTHCPSKLREAFFLSLEGCVRSIAPRALPQADLSLNQLLHQCVAAADAAKHTLHDADSSRQFYNSLVYCQCLILLALASDRPGPATVCSISQLLGQLAGCISEEGVNDSRILGKFKEQDREVYLTARRVFWAAIILDRFHASSHNKDLMLPLQSGGLSRDDYTALGSDATYHLARAAEIVGQIAFLERASVVPNIDLSSPFAFSTLTATSPQFVYLQGQLNGFRESIDIINLADNAPPQLAYRYLRVVAARLPSQASNSAGTLAMTRELIAQLKTGTITPLHHVFAGLVATALIDLSDLLETQVEAHAAIKDMSDALTNGQIVHPSTDGLGWDIALQDLLHQKKAATPPPDVADSKPNLQPNMAGLQHLAAAAVGEREGADARPLSSGGNGNLSQQSKIEHDLSAAMAAANEAAKAQATAAAAQQLSASPSANAGNAFDSSGF